MKNNNQEKLKQINERLREHHKRNILITENRPFRKSRWPDPTKFFHPQENTNNFNPQAGHLRLQRGRKG